MKRKNIMKFSACSSFGEGLLCAFDVHSMIRDWIFLITFWPLLLHQKHTNHANLTITWSWSESMLSGITSGFFSSLSLPSYSRLPTLLMLGPGDATLTVVLWWTSFLLFLLPQTIRTINITTQLLIKIAPPMPMAIEIKGLSEKLERGRSTTLKFKTILS